VFLEETQFWLGDYTLNRERIFLDKKSSPYLIWKAGGPAYS
jgi:hypothetical protein